MRRRLLTSIAIALVLLVPAIVAPVATSAQLTNNSTYYANHSSEVNQSGWMADREEPTLDNFAHYLTRIAGFYIGQEKAQGGVGPAGLMILSLVLFGALLRANDARQVGPVGGTVLAVSLAFAVITAGTAPSWIYAVALFVIGVVLSGVVVRMLR